MKLKVGQEAPQFELKDQNGSVFKSQSVIGKQTVVLFFYPKDLSPGCTAEVCSFRDHYEEYTQYGATVIGINTDSEKLHKKFVEKHQLPFILLSDPKKEVQKKYGVSGFFLGFLTKRVTFIISKEGNILMRHESNNATSHIKKTLLEIQK